MITKFQFDTLENLFFYYNYELFDGTLPDCLVNLSRRNNSHGFFAPERWKESNTKAVVHEISINPDTMSRPDRAWHSTFVHEMCHLWQEVKGTPPRRCYHDKEWAAKMEEIGLMPSDTGTPGGKKTGQNMTHYIIEGGAFDVAFSKISVEQLQKLKLPYQPNVVLMPVPNIPPMAGVEVDGQKAVAYKAPSKSRAGVKSAYVCGCNFKVWGRPGLELKCCKCDQVYQEQ